MMSFRFLFHFSLWLLVKNCCCSTLSLSNIFLRICSGHQSKQMFSFIKWKILAFTAMTGVWRGVTYFSLLTLRDLLNTQFLPWLCEWRYVLICLLRSPMHHISKFHHVIVMVCLTLTDWQWLMCVVKFSCYFLCIICADLFVYRHTAPPWLLGPVSIWCLSPEQDFTMSPFFYETQNKKVLWSQVLNRLFAWLHV